MLEEPGCAEREFVVAYHTMRNLRHHCCAVRNGFRLLAVDEIAKRATLVTRELMVLSICTCNDSWYCQSSVSAFPAGALSDVGFEIALVKSFAAFAELMHVWQALAHALGVSNILETTQFLQKVVFDGMSQLKLTWQEAYCLLLVYSMLCLWPRDCGMGSIWGST